MTKSRNIATWYSDADGVEHDIVLTAHAEGRNCIVDTELPDIPESDARALLLRAANLYWAAEHADYLRSPQAVRDGV